MKESKLIKQKRYVNKNALNLATKRQIKEQLKKESNRILKLK